MESVLRCRGLRGATTAYENSAEAVLAATRELLERIVERNALAVEDIASAFFTVTDDLDAAYPALAARQLGWDEVALLCAREIPVPGSVARCIRVLLHVNTTRSQSELRHVYLHEAVALRPGFADEPPSGESEESAGVSHDQPLGRVAILGMGLMGGSLGLALHERKLAFVVAGYDADADMTERALQRGALDVACATVAEAVAGSDLVVLATPVLAMRDLLVELAPILPPGAVVTDLGSTKTAVVSWATALLPDPGQFVGGHPMAGSEQTGIEAATASLFTDCTWSLTPTEETFPTALACMSHLVTALGAHPHEMAPERHDRTAALVSHLPLLAATALTLTVAESADTANGYTLAAGGFRDTTRVAAGSPRMARDICLTNRSPILAALDEYIAKLECLRVQISGEKPAIEGTFAAACDARRQWLSSQGNA